MRHDVRDTRRLPPEVLARFKAAGVDVPGLELRDQSGRTMIVEGRSQPMETRAAAAAGEAFQVRGYATVYDAVYPVMGGKDSGFGWDETIAVGACAKSVGERDDVRLLLNHDGAPYARTKSGTLTLASDPTGLLVEANVDATTTMGGDLRAMMARGDLDEMSFAFQVTRQEWNEDYTERFITECKLFDVSVVTYPANDATSVGIVPDPDPEPDPMDPMEPDEPPDDPITGRAAEPELVERRGFSVVDARALIDLAR